MDLLIFLEKWWSIIKGNFLKFLNDMIKLIKKWIIQTNPVISSFILTSPRSVSRIKMKGVISAQCACWRRVCYRREKMNVILFHMDQLPGYSKHFSLIQSAHVYRTDTNLILNRLKNNLNVQHGKFFFCFPKACA